MIKNTAIFDENAIFHEKVDKNDDQHAGMSKQPTRTIKHGIKMKSPGAIILSDRGKLEINDDFYPPSGELATLVLKPIEDEENDLR